MRDLQALHRRLVNALLAIVVIVLPFVANFWPGRVPPIAAAGICLLFAATGIAHALGRVPTALAARVLILSSASMVVGSSLLQVAASLTPADAWSHETHHIGRALMITTGGLYVTLGQRRGRRTSAALLGAFILVTLTVFGTLTDLPPLGLQSLTPLLDVVVSALLIAILFDVGAHNQRHLAVSRRSATRLAQVDALTGVNNRHGAEPAIRSVLASPGEAALVMLDLDHFKLINDTHGHAGGDRILREVGEALVEQTRTSDVVGRWGGEEFVIVVRDGGPEVALAIAERVRQSLHRISADFPISASFGVSMVRRNDTAEGLLKRADSAMYRAKAQGRDRVIAAWVRDGQSSEPPPHRAAPVVNVSDASVGRARARELSDQVMQDLIRASRERQNRN